MSVTFDPTGVQPNQVGPTYDIALGYYDLTTQAVKMYGYTVSPSGNLQEGRDVTDEQHLVQIASPNASDRYSKFPQVSQGDWTHGERQRLYVEPAMYYQSDGNVDTSTPGNLTLFPGTRTDTVTVNGTYNKCPMQTDGSSVYLGLSRSAPTNFAVLTGGAPSYSNSIMGGEELIDLLYTPFALIGLGADGLWTISNGSPPTSSHVVVDSIPNPEIAVRSLAYLDDVVYYIRNDYAGSAGTVKGYTRSTNSTATLLTSSASEPFFQCIASSASGLFVATTSKLPFQNFFYSWSGSASDTLQRIAEIQGRVEYAVEALGTVYVLCRQFQAAYITKPKWTLYGVVGSQVTVVDDMRWVTDSNFAPTCVAVDTFFAGGGSPNCDFSPMMWSDGRFLYISWPGLATRRIDLVAGGISAIGPNSSNAGNSVHSRRFLTSAGVPFTDVSCSATSAVITQFSQVAASGTLTFSFMDFDSPNQGKVFRDIEFQTASPLTGTQALAWSYRLDQASVFTALTTVQVGARDYVAFFPVGTKGSEIQLKVTLTADASAGAPTMTSMTVVADLGRVINMTVACRRNQQARSQDEAMVEAQPYTGQQLAANILNIFNLAGGRCFAYVPDPTQDNGVAQIQARLIDAQRTTPNGAAAGRRMVDGAGDMECDIALQLTESFDLLP